MNNLERFIEAQEKDYSIALKELKSGRKRSHWIWYIFPQIKGLGYSSTSKYYSINGKEEALEYIGNKVLSSRLKELCKVLLSLDNDDITSIMGYPDDLKLKSSMTLFSEVDKSTDLYDKVLDKYYDGKKDEVTLELLQKN